MIGRRVAPAPTATARKLEQERDHFLEQAARTAKDPALAAETALWRALAADVDEYLGRSPVEAQAGLWDETRGSPG